jgi:hypothetical protein
MSSHRKASSREQGELRLARQWATSPVAFGFQGRDLPREKSIGMSIDHFYRVVKGGVPVEIDCDREKVTIKRNGRNERNEGIHSIYKMNAGIERLYIFEDGAQAAETFEQWRRKPVEAIRLTLDGVRQAGGRLPPTEAMCRACEIDPNTISSVLKNSKNATLLDTGCDVDISWNGEYDTSGDPDGPAPWPVLCGQPVAGEVKGRSLCQKHAEAVNATVAGK